MGSIGAVLVRVWIAVLLVLTGNLAQADNLTWNGINNVSAGGQDIYDIHISLSSDGAQAGAVWRRYDGSKYIVQSAFATISGSTADWGAVQDLSASGQSGYKPQIAFSSDGTKATAVWERYDGISTTFIQSRSATISGNTASWGKVNHLSAGGGGSARKAQVALAADGSKAIAVWHHFDGVNSIVQSAYATISGNTATWVAAVDVSASLQDGFDPRVALSADGSRATAVWWYDGADAIVQSASAKIIGTTTTWGAISNLSTAGEDGEEARLALSSDGSKAITIWYRYNSDSDNYVVQSRVATIIENVATWSAVQDLSTGGENSEEPQIRMSSDGTGVTAVWVGHVFDPQGSYNPIRSRSATLIGNIATWGAVQSVTPTGQSGTNPQIAVASDGTRATALWRSPVDGGDHLIRVASASVSGDTAAWHTEQDLSATDEDADYPEIALSSDGSMSTAVWSRNEANNDIVQSTSGYIVSVNCYVIKSKEDKTVTFCL